jgi:hypothetical protein
MTRDLLLSRLQSRVREYDREVKRSLVNPPYEVEIADIRDLLEATVQFLRQQE